MKKILIILSVLMLTVVGCSQNTDNGDSSDLTLTIYTPAAQDNIDVVVPAFEAATGIKVNVIRGATGEIYSRIQAEAGNPQSDIAWLPTSTILLDTSYFEEYVSPHDSLYSQEFRNDNGFTTQIDYNSPVIIYNTDLVNFEIRGYQDLLDPSLKGKIAMGNAASSSSAYSHLENMLLAFGKGSDNDEKAFSDEAWDFVEKFYLNLDGKIVDSSSVTFEGVKSGEYAVGMSWDTPAYEYLKEEVPNIKVVFVEEGVIPGTNSLSIIKNAKNKEAAKKFIDWLSSKEGQSVYGLDSIGANPILPGAEVADYKKSIDELKVIYRTTEWQSESKGAILEKFQDLYTKVFE